jgi:aldehyde dehydrogenase (NAD+)
MTEHVGARAAILSQVADRRRANGEALVDDPRVALVSATGSTRMGARSRRAWPRASVAPARARRQQRRMIVTPADLDLAVRGDRVLGGRHRGPALHHDAPAVIVHTSVADELLDRIARLRAGCRSATRCEGTLVGPLIERAAFDGHAGAAVARARRRGGTVSRGRARSPRWSPTAYYVRPALVDAATTEVMHTETFAPILYVMAYDDLDEAIALQQRSAAGALVEHLHHRPSARPSVPVGRGSDCGIANVNIGTSGAEIGGAFGGEKETGGGRESGTDSWKAYMRRDQHDQLLAASCRWRRASSSTPARWLRRPRRGRLETMLSPVVEEAAPRPSRNRAVPGG